MPKFDATINGISLASYGVEPNMATVPQPEAKTYQAEIPGRDGLLDYTDAYGVVRYENRTVTIEAYEIGDITARMEHRRAICSDMHGKTCTLALTTLPGYTFTGRCSVEYDEDGSETTYKLSFDCQPYMRAGERTFYANCAGGVDLVFMSGDKPVKPRIEVPRRSIIIFNGQQYEVEAGTWTFDGILFKRGRNEVYINTYTEPGTTTWGDLESMTWEQIGWHHKTADASGALVNVTDALQARPNTLIVDGKAVQDGTPTPDAPIEVDVVDSPVSVRATGKNLFNVANKLLGGISFSTNENGIRLSGRSTSQWVSNSNIVANTNLSGKTCILSCNALPPEVCISISFLDKNGINLVKREVTGWAATDTTPVVVPEKTISILFIVGVRAAGTEVDFVVKPQVELGSTATTYEPYISNKQTITLPTDHNYIASLPDGTRDELVLRADGVAVLTERVGKVVFDGSASVGTNDTRVPGSTQFGLWNSVQSVVRSQATSSHFACVTTGHDIPGTFRVSATSILPTINNATIGVSDTDTDAGKVAAFKSWIAANPVTVYYKLESPATGYSADNGATWSTNDPNAGNSAIQLYKGTNNVWCTDALSPNVTLNYDTQERTRKQRISELYWRKNPPQRRLTWGQLATHTWAEIGSKPVQEWYYSGTADVVENAYINYEIGDL